MMIPQYWAEGRAHRQVERRRFTVRRFGWSDVSQEDAQANADARAREALERVINGEPLRRLERKVAYNGADGLPIREEIVSRHGETIVTRNSYGARCLNTPSVFFADIDFPTVAGCWWTLSILALSLAIATVISRTLHAKLLSGFVVLLALIIGFVVADRLYRLGVWLRGGVEQIARRRVERFLAEHPEWHLRVYRTPAGLRLLAVHRIFAADDPEVAACFRTLGTDPIYARMCLNQRCFRARVSPKPWRVGISAHMRPTGVWPVPQERLPLRQRWIEEYEVAAQSHASCRFLDDLGSATIHPVAREVQLLHDELCRATSELPIA